jgi:hypothetical protein
MKSLYPLTRVGRNSDAKCLAECNCVVIRNTIDDDAVCLRERVCKILLLSI